MAGPFDGMAATLSAVLGGSVTLTDPAGVTLTVTAIFREGPSEVQMADGRTLWVDEPTLRVRKDLAPSIDRTWLVAPAAYSPRTWQVLQPFPSGSPASDAHIICTLEEVKT